MVTPSEQIKKADKRGMVIGLTSLALTIFFVGAAAVSAILNYSPPWLLLGFVPAALFFASVFICAPLDTEYP